MPLTDEEAQILSEAALKPSFILRGRITRTHPNGKVDVEFIEEIGPSIVKHEVTVLSFVYDISKLKFADLDIGTEVVVACRDGDLGGEVYVIGALPYSDNRNFRNDFINQINNAGIPNITIAPSDDISVVNDDTGSSSDNKIIFGVRTNGRNEPWLFFLNENGINILVPKEREFVDYVEQDLYFMLPMEEQLQQPGYITLNVRDGKALIPAIKVGKIYKGRT